MKIIKKLPLAFILCAFGFFAFSDTEVSAAVTIHNLLSSSMYTWYNANSNVAGNTTFVGAYVMKAIGEKLYLGFNAHIPQRNLKGSLLASDDGTTLSLISNLFEDAVPRMKVFNNKLYIPGFDPATGKNWDAGDLFIYKPETSTLDLKRYRYSDWQFVDATTTDANGSYTFSGLTNTTYMVKVIKPADYNFTTTQVGSTGTEDADSNFDATTGEYLTCTDKGLGLYLNAPFTDVTIDAGLKTASGAAAGSSTSGTRNEAFFTGTYTIDSRVWLDTDTDGVQDTGENGIAGVRIEIYTKDPYFPCVIHANGLLADGNDMYYVGAANSPAYSPSFGAVVGVGSNATWKSTDGGETWALFNHEYTNNKFYFPYDVTKFNGNFYRIYFNQFFNDAPPWEYTYHAWLEYGSDMLNWTSFFDDRKILDDTLMSDGYVYDIFTSNFDWRDELTTFRNYLLLIHQPGTKIFKFSSGESHDVIDLHGADLSQILEGYVGGNYFPELGNSDLNATNRYNSFAQVGDEYLYAVGGDKKLYVTSNMRDWVAAADFTGMGTDIVTAAYWEAKNWVAVSAVGSTGSIYYVDHQEVVDTFFSKINNSSQLAFSDFDEQSVNLKTTGTIPADISVAVKKGNTLISKVDTTLTVGTMDWTTVDGDTDPNVGKAFTKNIEVADGTATTHDLYIPIPSGTTSDVLVICPHAESIENISANCIEAVVFIENETKVMNGANVTASKVTIGGQAYWVATGVTGTGGYAIPNNTISATNNCTQPIPAGILDLFEIKATKGSATLYFSPLSSADAYAIFYGPVTSPNEFATTFSANSMGVIQTTINGLVPGTTYQFSIQPLNGCASGAFSNSLGILIPNKIMKKTVYSHVAATLPRGPKTPGPVEKASESGVMQLTPTVTPDWQNEKFAPEKFATQPNTSDLSIASPPLSLWEKALAFFKKLF